MRRGALAARPTPEARDAERRALRVAPDLAPLLDHLGVRYRRGDGGRKLLGSCPSPLHPDRGPSWFINNDPDDRRYGTHSCSSCGFQGGPALLCYSQLDDWDAAARTLLSALSVVGDGGGEALSRAARRRLPGGPGRDSHDLLALGCVPLAGTPGEAYLRARGVGPRLRLLLGALWAPRGAAVPRPGAEPLDIGGRVVLPVVLPGGSVPCFAARAVRSGARPKYLYPPGPREDLVWGLHLWDPEGLDVGVAEGVLTALGAHAACEMPVYAALGSRLSPAAAARISSARSVTVFRDPGRAGELLPADAEEHLPNCAVRVLEAPPGRLDCADAMLPEGADGRLDPGWLRAAAARAADARGGREVVTRVRYAVAARRRAGA